MSTTTILDRIDQHLATDRDEIRRLEAARDALTGAGTTARPARPVHALATDRALAAIRKHPGASTRKLGIGPRTISALATTGRIERHGAGWKVARA